MEVVSFVFTGTVSGKCRQTEGYYIIVTAEWQVYDNICIFGGVRPIYMVEGKDLTEYSKKSTEKGKDRCHR